MVRIQLYTTAWCGFCSRAKALLEEHELPYEEIRLDDDPIGGYAELRELERRGLLDGLAA